MKYLISVLALATPLLFTNEVSAARLSPFQKGAEAHFTDTGEQYIRTDTRSAYGVRRSNTSYLSTRAQRAPRTSLRFSSLSNRSGTRKRSTSTTKAPIVPTAVDRENFEMVKANNIPFYFSVPVGFEKVSDNLEWDNGKVKFAKAKTTIEMFSTGERCDGGVAYARNCLYDIATKLNNQAKKNYPNTRVVEDKTTYLQHSTIAPGKNHMARSFISENSVEKVYKLTFTEPINGFVWNLKVYSENNSNTPLSQDSNYRRIIASLFQKGTQAQEKTLRPRVVEQNVFNYSRIRSQRPVITRLSGNNKFNAEQINFQIELPKGFTLKNDSIAYDSGEMVFEGNSTGYGGNIKITASDKKCDYDTSSLMRRCIEKASKESSDILWFETPGVQFLQEENLLFKPTFNQRTDDVGRIFIAREKGKRIGIFTFAEPINHHVWMIEMQTEERKDSFINDMREIRRIVTSMYFK